MSETTAVSWLKLPIVGMPGMTCGRRMHGDGSGTSAQTDFQEEFGFCDSDARWAVGMLLLCQDHAATIATEFGDDIAEIEKRWREECL